MCIKPDKGLISMGKHLIITMYLFFIIIFFLVLHIIGIQTVGQRGKTLHGPVDRGCVRLYLICIKNTFEKWEKLYNFKGLCIINWACESEYNTLSKYIQEL